MKYTLILVVSLLTGCGNNTTMELYNACDIGSTVTITVTHTVLGTESAISCTFVKEEE